MNFTVADGSGLGRGADDLLPTPDEAVMVLPLPQTPDLDLDDRLSAEWRPGELW